MLQMLLGIFMAHFSDSRSCLLAVINACGCKSVEINGATAISEINKHLALMLQAF